MIWNYVSLDYLAALLDLLARHQQSLIRLGCFEGLASRRQALKARQA